MDDRVDAEGVVASKAVIADYDWPPKHCISMTPLKLTVHGLQVPSVSGGTVTDSGGTSSRKGSGIHSPNAHNGSKRVLYRVVILPTVSGRRMSTWLVSNSYLTI